MKLKQIYEDIASNTFQMYHGGTKWNTPPEIRPSKSGRYEGGLGLYFTNNYETARKYAKGSKVVHLVSIDRNYKDIKNVKVSVNELVDFVKNLHGLKKKKEIISDIIRYSERVGKQEISLEIFNNLIVNWEAGSGSVGVDIIDYFKSKGADASYQSQSGDEFWLVVYNTDIIKKYTTVNPSKLSVDDYMLSEI